MIKTFKDLKYYKKMDKKCYPLWKVIAQGLSRSDEYYVVRFNHALRNYEYFLNSGLNVLNAIFYYIAWWSYRRWRLKSGIYILPNTFGPGLDIVHPGFIRCGDVRVGDNCTILPMVLMGKKLPGKRIEVVLGSNVYVGTGATILGPVTVGDNVTIAAGAVVNKDVPDNAIVAGVPAKIIKINS